MRFSQCALLGATIAMAAIAASGQFVPLPTATADLSLKNSTSSFRSGEEIVLEISVRTSGPGCFVASDTEPSPMDKIELKPTDGVYRWVRGDGPGSDASSWRQMEANKPAIIRIVLNDLYRFDERGGERQTRRYTYIKCRSGSRTTEPPTRAPLVHT